MKRTFNIVAGSILLALALPLCALVAALIAAAEGPGPIFIRQEATSRTGAFFLAAKFRCSPATQLGRWLSRYRLDELPMLINVIRGEIRLTDIGTL